MFKTLEAAQQFSNVMTNAVYWFIVVAILTSIIVTAFQELCKEKDERRFIEEPEPLVCIITIISAIFFFALAVFFTNVSGILAYSLS